ncbi:hypothetical protein BDV96DRAFT_690654 [Lophiotrema nucula]|uniref:Hydrophobic surface binding protein A-domain-containing protein n=1 Tax=Lophiotrema nucula TaxID=690887 RepID=A0A6A5YVZ0_9PLEO|nr:hypothetical protein BDV96DRAFT_690654 [Lophiotrema nucula]
MKASTIAAILSFTAAAAAAPASRTKLYGGRTNLNKRQALTGLQKAQADCQSGGNADPDTCLNVVNAINGWDQSVNTVNNFLNIAESLSGDDLTNNENTAKTAADLEPGFLTTLRNTPNLDATGQSAAATLDTFFPIVPDNVNKLLAAEESVQDGVNAINDARCNHVLQAIGDLWISAAAAAGADTPGRPLGPLVCTLNAGNVGDAYSTLQ